MSNNTLPTDQTGTTILPDPRQETVPRRIGAFFAQPVVIVWIIFVLMFPLSRIVSPNFPSLGQLESTLILGLFLVVVAFGQGFVILTGGFDLSVPQTIALGAFLTGYLANTGWPVMGAIVAATSRRSHNRCQCRTPRISASPTTRPHREIRNRLRLLFLGRKQSERHRLFRTHHPRRHVGTEHRHPLRARARWKAWAVLCHAARTPREDPDGGIGIGIRGASDDPRGRLYAQLGCGSVDAGIHHSMASRRADCRRPPPRHTRTSLLGSGLRPMGVRLHGRRGTYWARSSTTTHRKVKPQFRTGTSRVALSSQQKVTCSGTAAKSPFTASNLALTGKRKHLTERFFSRADGT